MISYVNISQTQVIDSGQYKCTADNGLAQVSHQAQISVLGPLQIKPMPNVTVVASTTFKVRCPVAGYPLSDIQWHHSGRRLPANHRQHVYENGTLEVEHMEKSQGDDGEYTCVANAPANGTPDENERHRAHPVPAPVFGSLYVSIKVRPTIEPFAISRSLREGQRASIMCTISSGDLPISISWFRNEQPLLALPGASSTLSAASGAGSVQMLPGAGAPQVAAAAGGNSSDEAQSSFPEDGSALAGVRISRVSDYSSTLLFESLLAQHSANYTCLARNDAGQVSHQAPMVVQGELICARRHRVFESVSERKWSRSGSADTIRGASKRPSRAGRLMIMIAPGRPARSDRLLAQPARCAAVACWLAGQCS